ncbi:MAG: hypothetical protein ACYT04_72870 [Nostoc sp.]
MWLFNSDPTIGDEISKIRPAISVNSDEIGSLRLKVVVPQSLDGMMLLVEWCGWFD